MHRFALSVSILAILAGLSLLTLTSFAKARGAGDAGQSRKTSASSLLEPGQWQFDSHTKELRIPGMPADYGAKQIALEQSGEVLTRVTRCISPAEAEDPRQVFSVGDKSCRFPHFIMANGNVSVELVCGNAQQGETKTITGTYTRSSMAVDMSARISGGPRSGGLLKTHIDAQRIGACSE